MFLGKAYHKFYLVICKQFPILKKKAPAWGKNRRPSTPEAMMLPLPYEHMRRAFTKFCTIGGLWATSWFRKKKEQGNLKEWPDYLSSSSGSAWWLCGREMVWGRKDRGSRLGVDGFFFGSEREGTSLSSKKKVKPKTWEELKMSRLLMSVCVCVCIRMCPWYLKG